MRRPIPQPPQAGAGQIAELADSTPTGPDAVRAATPFAAASTASGVAMSATMWDGAAGEDEPLVTAAMASGAWAQLVRCFARWQGATRRLHSRALRRLAANTPVDPNERSTWRSSDAHATAVLRRHGITTLDSMKLSDRAVNGLIRGQRDADQRAGLDWQVLHDPPSLLDDRLREAHRTLPVDLGDPQMWKWPEDQRRVLAETLGVSPGLADELSRWALAHPDLFDEGSLRCWCIASGTWLRLAAEQLDPVGVVDRPVGVFIAPAPGREGWCLEPCLSLPMIRLISELGGTIDRTLRGAVVPMDASAELLERINTNTLHCGDTRLVDTPTQLSSDLARVFGRPVRVSLTDKRDRWGRIHVTKHQWKSGERAVGELRLKVMTTTVKAFATKRLGATDVDSLYSHGTVTRSAAMELGEAVVCAVERGLPLLLSSEAAGMLDGTTRVGRMKGCPGVITITSSDGMEASTSRVVAEQAISRMRALRDSDTDQQKVVLDAGARQVLRMTLARPLTDDPVLLGCQQEIAAVMAVGSGVNASQTGTGKTVVTARGALYQRAATIPGFRGSWSRRDGCSASGWPSSPRGRPRVGCRRWCPTPAST
jgi:hypothetical protein